MFRRVLAAVLGPALGVALLAAVPSSAAPVAAAVQTLTWTASDRTDGYTSAPTQATAGAAHVVFENSMNTGNTTGMPHTLTFDTTTPGFNHDVNLNILANPFDSNGGRHEADITLTAGRYRYFCSIQGHQMVGELVVSGGTVDTTPPVTSADVAGDRDPSGNYLGSATVTLSATDSESGVDRIEYSLDSTAFVRYSAPVVVSAVGSHMLHYRATDVAGNTAPEKMVSFTVVARPDTTPPVTAADVSGNRDPSGNYLGSATVTITATDTESGVATIEYEVDDTGFQRYTGPVAVTRIGDHSVQYRATDNAGNVAPIKSVQFRVVEAGPVDTTPPTVSTNVTGDRDGNGNYLGSATVTITATDTESGVDRIEYSLDGAAFTRYTAPVVVSTVGSHMVHSRATDVAGNTSPEQLTSFTVVARPDTTPPTVSATVTGDRDGNGNYLGSATVTITATDTESGVDRIEYSLDGAAFTPYTAPVVVSTVGSHMVHSRAIDRAGNTSPEQLTSFTVVARPDTTPPTVSAAVSGDRDGSGNYLGSATVTITATDTESGVDRIEYSLDGAAFTPYTAPVVVSTVGSHMVHSRAIDRAGNTSPEQMTSFTVVARPDTTPPTVSATVSGDRDGSGNYLGSATVTITATDTESGVDRIEYSVDGGAFTQYTAPVVVNQAGSHSVRYRATDRAGNSSSEQTTQFTVVARPDTTPPTVSAEVTGTRDGNGNYVGRATVTITATDTESGVDRVEYSLDGAAFGPYTGPVAVTQTGAHTVRYRATDRAGNASAEQTAQFTVVPGGPDACPDSDTRSTVILGDQDSGVANVDIGNGCTINDLIDEHGHYSDHASFVRHVDRVTEALVADGVISRRDKGSIVLAAARSSIGN
jgi:uncharacterized cupredoxin-like copper-binding protein